MNTNSNVYTVVYTALVVVVVAAILSFTAMKLGPLQNANAKAETLRQMMSAAGVKPTDELYATRNQDILRLYAENIEQAYTIGLDGGQALEEIEDGIRYVLAPPYGMEKAKAVTFFTPGNRERVVTSYAKTPEGSFVASPDFYDATMDPAQTPVGARPNLITSSTDFATFMQMLANGGTYKGKKFLGAGTVAMLHANQLGEAQMKDFTNDYLAGYGYGYGFRTLLTQEYGHNGHIGCFGWTGGSGIWVEADPVDKFSIAYMHNMMPNEELYHHHRVRATAYGIML